MVLADKEENIPLPRSHALALAEMASTKLIFLCAHSPRDGQQAEVRSMNIALWLDTRGPEEDSSQSSTGRHLPGSSQSEANGTTLRVVTWGAPTPFWNPALYPSFAFRGIGKQNWFCGGALEC